MAKIEIKIQYIAEWTDKSARVLVLQTKDQTISFPVIIAENEAFSLIKEIEHFELKRPQTHDLTYIIMQNFQIEMHAVYIYNLIEGIFHTSIDCSMNDQHVHIESRVSDAVILALKYQCPIFIEDFILEQVGMGKNELNEDAASSESETDLSHKSIKELEEILQEAVENENFEYASLIRDEINKKN